MESKNLKPNTKQDMKHGAPSSTLPIKRRLFTMLMITLGTVIILSGIFMFILTGLFLGRTSNIVRFFGSPLFSSLETYYLVHGNWNGVDTIFTQEAISPISKALPSLEDVLLLDKGGYVLVDHGSIETPLVGTVYQGVRGDVKQVLQVRTQPVGAVVLGKNDYRHTWPIIFGVLRPIGLLSLLPAILVLIIGMLLTRRMVSPLSDVIAAAQSVAAGDLSARVQLRGPDDLRALSDSFNHMADTLEQNDRERREMLADIAHELRTPLTVIRGRLEGVLDGVYNADEAHIAQVLEETYLLERLVDDLRLLTLTESRQLHFDLQPVDLGELAEQAVSLFEAEASEHNITLTLAAESGLPPINADPQRMEQVIGNLLSNAVRYVPDGGRVEVRVANVASAVEFTIADNGPGLSEADLPHIYDRFWRGERSRTRSAGGAGLGLTIARQLVEAQNGSIFARNQPEGGLLVGFRIPAKYD
jgi:signal transduction histidine kinase